MSLTADEITAAGLHLDISDAVATVTLSRPDKRNAQTPAMWHALAAVGEQLPETVRVVVVRGAGHSFSAGLDRAMLDPATGEVARLLQESDEHLLEIISDHIRSIDGVLSTETFMYLHLRKQTYSWGVR